MVRKHVYFHQYQLNWLSELPGIFSEHIRKAVDDYIEKTKPLTASASKSKAGEHNG